MGEAPAKAALNPWRRFIEVGVTHDGSEVY